jgi:hypothetical protein
MAVTERYDHATEAALDRLAKWAKNPKIDGGENINFSVSRQGAPSPAFLAFGDCTPFTPSGRRGILTGHPAGNPGAPVACFENSVGTLDILQQVPCTFSFDLNTGKVHLSGEFPNNLPSNLEFGVEYFKQFDAVGVENILFYSDQTSDNAGYVIAMQLVAASEGRTQVAHSPLRSAARLGGARETVEAKHGEGGGSRSAARTAVLSAEDDAAEPWPFERHQFMPRIIGTSH